MSEAVLLDFMGVSSTIAARAPRNDSYKVECKLCDVKCESLKTWEQHLDSKRHRTATKSKNLSHLGFPLGSGNGANAGGSGSAGASMGTSPNTPAPPGSHDMGHRQASNEGVPKPRSAGAGEGVSSGIDVLKALQAQGAKVPSAAPVPSAAFGKTFAKNPLPQPAAPVPSAPAPKSAAGAGAADKTPPYYGTHNTTGGATVTTVPGKTPVTILQRPQNAGTAGTGSATSPAKPNNGTPGSFPNNNGNGNTANNSTNNNSNNNAASSSSTATAVVVTGAVNANKAKLEGVVVVEAPAAVPLVDPSLHRLKTRSVPWLGTTKLSEVTPMALEASANTGTVIYSAVFRVHVNLYNKVLAPDAAPAADTTLGKVKAAWDLIMKDMKLKAEKDGAAMMKIETSERITLIQLRAVESFLTAATFLAPYDDQMPQPSQVPAAQIQANFWSS